MPKKLEGFGSPIDAATRVQDVTVDLPLLTPNVPEEMQVLAEGEGIVDENALPFWERVGISATMAPTYNLVTGLLDDYSPEVDPDFSMLDHQDVLAGMSTDDYDYMTDSVNEDDMHVRKSKIESEQTNMRDLVKGGSVSGMAIMMGTQILDPITMASMAVEGAGVLQVVSKANRLRKVIALGVTGGALAAAETGIVAANMATVDAEDMLYAGISGFVLSAGIGYAGNAILDGGDISKAADVIQDRTARNVMQDMDETLGVPKTPVEAVDDTDTMFGKFDPEATAEVADDVPITKPDAVGIEAEDEVARAMGMKNAYIANVDAQIANGSFDPEVVTNSRVWKVLKKNPAMSDFVRMFESGSKRAQYLAMQLLENASGVGGRKKTAAVLKHMWQRGHLEAVMPLYRSGYKAFTKERGIRLISREYWSTARKEFNELLYAELTRYNQASIRGTKYVSTEPSYIQDVATSWRKNMKEVGERNKHTGVRGFEDIHLHDGYVPLIWTGRAINKVIASGKLPQLTKLLTKGYTKAGVDELSAEVIAKAVLSRKSLQAMGVDTNPGALLSKDSRTFLKDILTTNGMSKEAQEKLFQRIDSDVATRGSSARGKQRTPIDMNESEGDMRLMDFVDTDLASVGTRYFSEMSGRAALATKGVRHDGAWSAIKEAIKEELASSPNLDTIDKVMDGLYQQFMSRPVGTGVHRGGRRLMELAMTSMLGMVGVPQMAEMANVFAAHGVANVIRYSPDLRAYGKAIKEGTADKTLLGELNSYFGGMWDEHLFFRPEVRLEQAGGGSEGIWNVLDNTLAGAQEIQGYVSGMNHIKNMEQQMTAIGQANKVISYIKKGKHSQKILDRFADSGWDEKMLSKLKTKIDDGTITFQNNGAVDRLNLEKWDAKMVEDFGVGMHRHSAQVIQFPMVGESAFWQHSTFGAMMTQFRTFSLLAIEKQSGRQFKYADGETALAVGYSLGLSSMLYYAKAHATSLGRPDREEYLEKKLSAGAVITGATQWSGILSVMAEGITLASAVGLAPKEWGGGVGRSGGAAAPSLDSNIPAWSVARSGIKAATGMFSHIAPFSSEKEGFKSEINSTMAALPLGNTAPGIALKNLLHRSFDAPE